MYNVKIFFGKREHMGIGGQRPAEFPLKTKYMGGGGRHPWKVETVCFLKSLVVFV